MALCRQLGPGMERTVSSMMMIPGADPTIIDHEPCGHCETDKMAVTYHTAIPDRNAYVSTWYSWTFGHGESAVFRLGEKRCEQCGSEHWCPQTGRLSLYSRSYAPATVSRGGLAEGHAHLVEMVLGNRLPELQGGSRR